MNKQTTILVIVIALVVFSGVQAFQISKIRQGSVGSFLSEGSSGGEGYEEMMARMHPDQAGAGNTRSSQPSSSSASMVGGC